MYRDYIAFNIDSFSKDLEECLKRHFTYNYSYSQKFFLKFLNKHAPIEKKILRFKNPFMSKALREAIMHRSKLIKYLQQMQNWRQVVKLQKENKFVLICLARLRLKTSKN